MKRFASSDLKLMALSVLGFLLLFLVSLNSLWLSELTLGWIGYSLRVFPNVHVRWDGVAIFLVGFAIATACFHHLVQWWIKEKGVCSQDNEPVQWRLRSSVGIVLMFLSTFVVGISMAGVVHQTGWLLTSPTSLTVEKIQSNEDAEMSVYDPERTPAGTSWLTAIRFFLPFMLEDDREPNHTYDGPFNNSVNAKNFKRVLPAALCPSQGNPVFSKDGFGLSHVVANPSALGGNLMDKNSSSIMLGEINTGFTPWGSPHNFRNPALGIRQDWRGTNKEKVGLGSQHTRGVVVCLVDGSTQFLSEATDPEVLRQLANATKTK